MHEATSHHDAAGAAFSSAAAAGTYDEKLAFVSRYATGLVELLDPKPGESVLDLGCGTGDLTRAIADRGAAVLGIDISEAMIARARAKYPDLEFAVADGHTFSRTPPCRGRTFDAVFSNAALHWMKGAKAVARCVGEVLKPGGRFVAEFGGKGNVRSVVEAILAALAAQGLAPADPSPWYFPSLGEYAALLERVGLRVTFAALFERPTPQEDGEEGLAHWLAVFGAPLLHHLDEKARRAVAADVAARLRPHLFHGGSWVIDYVRLRIVAVRD